jgi:hypothetical protein
MIAVAVLVAAGTCVLAGPRLTHGEALVIAVAVLVAAACGARLGVRRRSR